jgi:hypothetical protein
VFHSSVSLRSSGTTENIIGSLWETLAECGRGCSGTARVIPFEVAVGPGACSLLFVDVKRHHRDFLNPNDVASPGTFVTIEKFKRGGLTVENANKKCTWDASITNIREELLVV